MSDLNNINLIGNLTKDCELKYLQDGKAINKFSIAVNDGWGDKKSTSFFDIVCFGKLAENVSNFIAKGSKIALSGKLKQNSWTTQNNEKRYSISIIANEVQFLTPKKTEGNNSAQKNNSDDIYESSGFSDSPFDNDVPF